MDNWKYEQLTLALKGGFAQLCGLVKAKRLRLRRCDNSTRQLWLGLSCAVPVLPWWKRAFLSLRRLFRILIKPSA